MSVLGFISGLFEPVAKLVDDLVLSGEEKLKAKEKIAIIKNDFESKIMDYEKNVIDKKTEIMVAELNQEDKFTKRARPTILYSGILIVLLNNILLPWATYLFGLFSVTTIVLPTITLPSEFWIAWGGVAGIYSFKRTTEKVNKAQNK